MCGLAVVVVAVVVVVVVVTTTVTRTYRTRATSKHLFLISQSLKKMSPPTFPQDPPAYFSDQVLPSSDGVGGLEGRVGLGLSHVQRPHLLCQKGTLCHTWIPLANVDGVFIPRRKALIPVAQYLVETDTETQRERERDLELENFILQGL